MVSIYCDTLKKNFIVQRNLLNNLINDIFASCFGLSIVIDSMEATDEDILKDL